MNIDDANLQIKHKKTIAVVWAVVTFFVTNIALANSFCTDGFVFYPGLIAAGLVWFYLDHTRVRPEVIVTKEPTMARYALPRNDIVGILKETVPNINFEDRWWILHWMNKDRGEMKFRVNYDPAAKKGEKEKQQIVLDAYVKQEESSGACLLRLVYQYTQNTDEDRAIEMITHTTESIEYKLKAAEAGRI